MTPERWAPGGDKYESMKADEQYERMTFYGKSGLVAGDKEFLSSLKSVVSTWTEETMDESEEPLISEFLDKYPEYNDDRLYGFITKERDRVECIILRDREEVETSQKR